MPNGRPGDHPYTDIVVHKQNLYSKEIADKIRMIAEHEGGIKLLDTKFGWSWDYEPDKSQQKVMLDKLETIVADLDSM